MKKEYSIRTVKNGKLFIPLSYQGIPYRFTSTSYEKAKNRFDVLVESNNYEGKLVLVIRKQIHKERLNGGNYDSRYLFIKFIKIR